jgi:hypothetical protein
MYNNWSLLALSKIKELKKTILKKKVMLNFIIDSYAWWDKAYRWFHISIAAFTPFIGIVSVTVEKSKEMQILFVILSSIVATMLKLKEYILFEKIRDVSKGQTILYSQLYERIERETIKPDNKKQPEDEFIYWINREFSHIELGDPELTYSDKDKFIKLCQSKGIPFDDDMDALQLLLKNDNQLLEIVIDTGSNMVETPLTKDKNKDGIEIIDKNKDGIEIIDKNKDGIEIIDKNKDGIEIIDKNKDGIEIIDKNNSINDDLSSKTLNQDLNNIEKKKNTIISTDHSILSNHKYLSDLHQSRTESDKHERNSYKETLRKMNSKADMTWAMTRLRDLD